MNYTSDRHEFAAAQGDIQAKDEQYLIGSARHALRHVGEEGWYSALVRRVEQVARTAYRRESGRISSDTLRARLNQMKTSLADSLDKTKKPTREQLESRALALAKSLSSLANALGVEAASQDDENDIGLEWVTMHDDRVRDTHHAADGQVRRPNEKYNVGGYEMSRPGDVTVPIELWINCRCALRPVRMDDASLTAAAADYEEQGIAVFLLPAQGEPITDLSSENPPHVTVAFMGKTGEQDVDIPTLTAAVEAASASLTPVTADVKERGTLGDDNADVAFLNRDQLAHIHTAVTGQDAVAAAMAKVEQYPEWLPHLTLGYPDNPAADGELPSTVTLDRLALFVGRENYQYHLGGDMPTDQNVADDTADFEDNIDDIGEVEVPVEMVPWHGVLAPEGVESGDGRKFREGVMRWRDLPLPLAWQKPNLGGHDGSVVVARIDNIWRDENNLLQGEGVFAVSTEAEEVIGLIADQHLRGVSVDVDDAAMAFEDADGNEVSFDSLMDPDAKVTQVLTDGRICGATICSIPAFAEAYIALGPHPNPPSAQMEMDGEFRKIDQQERDRMAKNGQALPDGSFPIANVEDLKNAIQAIGRAKDPAKAKAHIKKRASALGHTELIPDGWAAETETFVKTEDGPGWLTHPVDTERLRRYWTKGKGAAKIRWGVPGDFNRCREQLAKYVKPQYLSGYCANRHYDALGFWPGRPVSADRNEYGGTMAPALRLVASGSVWSPPLDWFDDPGLTEPTRLTITDEGRIYGHLAVWGTCHIGYTGVCVTPPESPSGYANFGYGVIECEGGTATGVGQITMGCGHAPDGGSPRVAAAHYDNLGWAIADIKCGEDEFGIWYSGALRKGVDEEQVAALRAAGKLSGDWRDCGEGLDLVAALAVNVNGFSIPSTTLAASGGRQTSLVAAGIVQDDAKKTMYEIVMEAIDEAFDIRARREAMAALRVEAKRDPASKMAALAAERK